MTDRTFNLDVPGEGTFTFRRRTPRIQIALEADKERMHGGEGASENLRGMAMMVATLDALTVKGPEGWDMDAMDPLEPSDLARIQAVWGALRAEERTFRRGAGS